MPTKLIITIGLIAALAFVGMLLRRHRYRRPRTPQPHERLFDDRGVRERLEVNRTAEHQRWPHPQPVQFPKRERPPER